MLVPTSLPLSGSNLYGGLFWPVYVIWLGTEILVLSRRRAASAHADPRDRGSVRLLQLAIFLGLMSAFMCATAAPSTVFPVGLHILFYLGVTLMVAGLALRWWAVRVLGRFFTIDVAIHQAQPVVDRGPYRIIRHPAYTGSLLTFVGVGLALGSWLGLLLVVISTSIGFANRIGVEETALCAALGVPYRAYITRTWRLIPFLF